MGFAASSRGITRFMSHVCAPRHSIQQRTCHGVPRDSCAPKERPPCPPCKSPAPPPCRRTTRESPRAIRKVCCAPPAGHRPPCPPPEPPCTFICKNQLSSKEKKQNPLLSRRKEARQGVKCGAQLDRVAQRLAAAEERRRKQYVDEASQPLRAYKTPSPAPYSLTGKRHCARATDGRDYMCPQTPAPARTCVDGVPPPPTPVPIISFEACDIQTSRHLDPCAHKPRVFIEIDRTSTDKSSKKISGESKTSGNSTCPRQQYNQEKDRCTTPPQIVAVPPPCREPSLVERLRRGIGGNSGGPSRRDLHTRPRETSFSTTLATGCSGNTNIDKLPTVLKEMENLEETTRGRTVGLVKSKNLKPKNTNSGYLKLPIPPDADSVKVQVTLDVNHPAVTSQEATSNYGDRGASDSWLSIKNIQKKLAGNKRRLDSKRSKNNNNSSCPVRPASIPANPCAPSRTKPCNPPRTPPTANPCAPKDNRTRSVSTLHPLYTVML